MPEQALAFVRAERARGRVIHPGDGDMFRALELTPPDSVRVVILGQDPYHGPGQAHGLSFSVPAGVKVPPSLRNIYKELRDEFGVPVARSGCLEPWARRGVLLLNSVLTVEEGKAGSHRGRGWEPFTDAVIERVRSGPPVVFLLWGAWAQSKGALLEGGPHAVLKAPHPSPLSAHRGFFGSRPFSQANAFLEEAGRGAVDWRL